MENIFQKCVYDSSTFFFKCYLFKAHLLSIFDNIATVKFDPMDYNKIVAVVSKEEEVIKLEKSVRAEGSVELWLMSLLTSARD